MPAPDPLDEWLKCGCIHCKREMYVPNWAAGVNAECSRCKKTIESYKERQMSQGFNTSIAAQIAEQGLGNSSKKQPTESPRARILNEAMKITHHDRQANYGNPEDNFKTIAKLWTAYWHTKLSASNLARIQFLEFDSADVAVMNMLIKVARLAKNPAHHDSAVDIAGYAACLGDIQELLRSVQSSSAIGGAAMQQNSQDPT